ncbi:hypothetical protein GCM10022381_04430 [Leifsonia kafniensis]|uniref:Uncharacterized protein n=1 Tax=Leifsonia kafniensis TaxID=475957 RepID=A0ABP7K2B2_9MICO
MFARDMRTHGHRSEVVGSHRDGERVLAIHCTREGKQRCGDLSGKWNRGDRSRNRGSRDGHGGSSLTGARRRRDRLHRRVRNGRFRRRISGGSNGRDALWCSTGKCVRAESRRRRRCIGVSDLATSRRRRSGCERAGRNVGGRG